MLESDGFLRDVRELEVLLCSRYSDALSCHDYSVPIADRSIINGGVGSTRLAKSKRTNFHRIRRSRMKHYSQPASPVAIPDTPCVLVLPVCATSGAGTRHSANQSDYPHPAGDVTTSFRANAVRLLPCSHIVCALAMILTLLTVIFLFAALHIFTLYPTCLNLTFSIRDRFPRTAYQDIWMARSAWMSTCWCTI